MVNTRVSCGSLDSSEATLSSSLVQVCTGPGNPITPSVSIFLVLKPSSRTSFCTLFSVLAVVDFFAAFCRVGIVVVVCIYIIMGWCNYFGDVGVTISEGDNYAKLHTGRANQPTLRVILDATST